MLVCPYFMALVSRLLMIFVNASLSTLNISSCSGKEILNDSPFVELPLNLSTVSVISSLILVG